MNHKLKILITNNSGNKFLPIFESKKYDNIIVFDFDLEKKRKSGTVEKIRNFIESNKKLIFNKTSFMVDIFLENDVKTLVLLKYLNLYKEDFINAENKLNMRPLTYVMFHPVFKKFMNK
jgi:hypothetical protein